MLLVFIYILFGISEVDEEYFRIIFECLSDVDHNILELEVVESSLSAMSVLEDAHKLGSNINNFLNFLHSLKLA